MTCPTTNAGGSHHGGCACHEAAHRAEVDALRQRADAAEKGRDGYLAGYETELEAHAETRAEVVRLTGENASLTKRLAEMAGGIVLRGWWCLPCGTFCSSEKEELAECRSCGRPRTVNPHG